MLNHRYKDGTNILGMAKEGTNAVTEDCLKRELTGLWNIRE